MMRRVIAPPASSDAAAAFPSAYSTVEVSQGDTAV